MRNCFLIFAFLLKMDAQMSQKSDKTAHNVNYHVVYQILGYHSWLGSTVPVQGNKHIRKDKLCPKTCYSKGQMSINILKVRGRNDNPANLVSSFVLRCTPPHLN